MSIWMVHIYKIICVCWRRCRNLFAIRDVTNNAQGWVDYKSLVVRYNYSYFKNM